jgi:hypothetical protein
MNARSEEIGPRMNANDRGKGSVPHVFGNKVLPDAQPRRLCHTILYRSAEISVDQCDSAVRFSKSHVRCVLQLWCMNFFLGNVSWSTCAKVRRLV